MSESSTEATELQPGDIVELADGKQYVVCATERTCLRVGRVEGQLAVRPSCILAYFHDSSAEITTFGYKSCQSADVKRVGRLSFQEGLLSADHAKQNPFWWVLNKSGTSLSPVRLHNQDGALVGYNPWSNVEKNSSWQDGSAFALASAVRTAQPVGQLA